MGAMAAKRKKGLTFRENSFAAKIWFGRPGIQIDQGDLKGERDLSWCGDNLGPLTFISPLGRLPRMPDDAPIPLSMRNYKFVVVEIREEDGDHKPGYYLSTLTPKRVWEKLQEGMSPVKLVGRCPIYGTVVARGEPHA